jgi:sulfatase maturation enzyme AslB (radical SAM superfamily)
MKASSLSISIPVLLDENGNEVPCNKNCKYCISKMTKKPEVYSGFNNFACNLEKAKFIATNASVNSIIITGKSEPLMNLLMVKLACDTFKDFPIELQTNGLLLLKNISLVKYLKDLGVNTIAISIDNANMFRLLEKVFEEIKKLGMNIRATINITESILGLFNGLKLSVNGFISYVSSFGVDQISLRKITIPTQVEKNILCEREETKNAVKWIKENIFIYEKEIDFFYKSFESYIRENGEKVCTLSFGAVLYMVHEVSCTVFDYCIQDETTEEEIRSLVYYEDGHLSRSWVGSNWGRIF